MEPDKPAASEHRIPVVIVDDAKFTLEMLRRVLQSTGYTDIRVARSAEEALAMMQERRAGILLADWLMPHMDGLTLTRHVRHLDDEAEHYTYIILLTAREGLTSLTQAFENGVDDFIYKSPDNQELLARIHAAGRISQLQNDLLAANRRLSELYREVGGDRLFDTETGLGNWQLVEKQLQRLLQHVDGRGGSACVALIRANELAAVKRAHGDAVGREVVCAMAQRLERSVRPMDTVGRVAEDTFVVLMHHEHPDGCHPHTLRRVHQALNLRAYQTMAGYLSATAAVSLCNLDREAARSRPSAERILEVAASRLDEARAAARVMLADWPD